MLGFTVSKPTHGSTATLPICTFFLCRVNEQTPDAHQRVGDGPAASAGRHAQEARAGHQGAGQGARPGHLFQLWTPGAQPVQLPVSMGSFGILGHKKYEKKMKINNLAKNCFLRFSFDRDVAI